MRIIGLKEEGKTTDNRGWLQIATDFSCLEGSTFVSTRNRVNKVNELIDKGHTLEESLETVRGLIREGEL